MKDFKQIFKSDVICRFRQFKQLIVFEIITEYNIAKVADIVLISCQTIFLESLTIFNHQLIELALRACLA